LKAKNKHGGEKEFKILSTESLGQNRYALKIAIGGQKPVIRYVRAISAKRLESLLSDSGK